MPQIDKPIKKILIEVAIMRPILILCIVIGHSFAIYNGAWPSPFEVNTHSIYRYINPLFISFQLAGFVFISGHVDEYLNSVRKIYNVLKCINRKTKRILIPAWIFGAIYYSLFLYETETFTLSSCLSKILLGAGHLWFLPMLFGCIVLTHLLEAFKINKVVLFILLFVAAILPFQFTVYTQCLHYIFYYHLGKIIWRENTIKKFITTKPIIGLNIVIYIMSFILYVNKNCDTLQYWSELIKLKNITPLFSLACINAIKITMCVSGIFSLLGCILWIIEKYNIKENLSISYSNRICYGVYIFHQFILYYLVYYTSMVNIIEYHVLPFILLGITLVLSVLVAHLTLKSRIGRFLIG